MSWDAICRCKKVRAESLLSELAEAWRARDDLAHLIRSDFVAAEPEKFTRDVLNLADAQSKRHQPRADGHQAAAHQPGEAAAFVRSCDRSLGARNRVDQGLDFVGRALTAKETQDNADGLFSHSTIDAGLGGQPFRQFVHIAPPQPISLPAPYLGIYLEL